MCRCSLARTYPRGLFIEPHEHAWGRLLYAMSGVMWVETPNEALVVPPQRAVWLPPGVSHGIRVVTDLQMRSIYLRPCLAATLDSQVQVLQVDNLLRELIVRLVEHDGAAAGVLRRAGGPGPAGTQARPALAAEDPAAGQLRPAPGQPLPGGDGRAFLTFLRTPRRGGGRQRAHPGAAVQDGLGMGFAEWRRQVQLATAAAELIQGVPVSTIARELGYSPAASATCSAASWGWHRRNTRPEKPAPEPRLL